MLNVRAPAQSKGTATTPKSKGRGKLGSKGKDKTRFRQHRTGANCTPLGPVTPAAEGDGDDSSSFTLGGFAEPVGIPDGGDSDSQSGVSEGRYSEGRSSRSDDGHGSGYDLEGIQEQHQYELEALRQKQALYRRQHHPQCLGQHCLICPAGLHRHEQLDLLRRQKLELLDLQEAYANAHTRSSRTISSRRRRSPQPPSIPTSDETDGGSDGPGGRPCGGVAESHAPFCVCRTVT